jgi:hypothetical protein
VTLMFPLKAPVALGLNTRFMSSSSTTPPALSSTSWITVVAMAAKAPMHLRAGRHGSYRVFTLVRPVTD